MSIASLTTRRTRFGCLSGRIRSSSRLETRASFQPTPTFRRTPTLTSTGRSFVLIFQSFISLSDYNHGIRTFATNSTPPTAQLAKLVSVAETQLANANLPHLRRSLERFESGAIHTEAHIAHLETAQRELEGLETLAEHVEELKLSLELAGLEEPGTKAAEVALLEAQSIGNALESTLLDLEDNELLRLLDGPYDELGARVTIDSRVGGAATGVDSQIWVSMLGKCYRKWAESRGYRCQVVQEVVVSRYGSTLIELDISGAFAFGFLRSEHGSHQTIWITPFNNTSLKQRSFAAIEVIPNLEEDAERALEIPEKDLKITTMRSSGPGGQSVNKTESAVRIEHIPTGLSVRSEEHKSQASNKAAAMKRLKARLAAIADAQRAAHIAAIRGDIIRAEFSERIRSYFLVGNPQRAKDERTGYQVPNPEGILERGDLDQFMLSYLRWRKRGSEAGAR